MAIYTPPSGDAVSLAFSGELYTPPLGDGLALHFTVVVDGGGGGTDPVPFPEPPSLIVSYGSQWQQASNQQPESAALLWANGQ
ncbi:hypothetical protein, partial [Sansalvadorimonas verongulae]|uniref:hypothetical protein n=1 Tax=Sansalvadorimonas verongulae TaxID=2172824 RepID=UPI0012BC84FF